jgi:hypothetical protein
VKSHGKFEYQLAVISYIDILGFRDLLHSDTPGRISKILRLFKEASIPEPATKDVFGAVEFQNFSDLCVRYLPVARELDLEPHFSPLHWELSALVYAQYRLIEQQIVIRGGFTVGEIRKSRNVIYGLGLVKAYELENTSKFPRILVDPNIFRLLREMPNLRQYDFQREKAEIERLLRREGGTVFVDYLGAISSEFDEEMHYIDFLRTHRDFIQQRLTRYRQTPGILPKYMWLAEYHNAVVRDVVDKTFLQQWELDDDFAEALKVEHHWPKVSLF